MALPHLAAGVLFFAPHAHARTVDRIAAIAGAHVIMMSEVVERSPLRTINEKDPIARARAETVMLRATCEGMIDAALEDDEAERVHLTVEPDEIARAAQAIAKNVNMTLEQLDVAAHEQGYGDVAYRAAIRAQIVEAKLVMLRKKGVTKDENELAALARALHTELRSAVYVEDRIAP